MNENRFVELPCTVCALLTSVTQLALLDECNIDLSLLKSADQPITRKERFSADDAIEECEGPIILPNCNHICADCLDCLQKRKIPVNALANGLWIGEVPPQLCDLTWVEKMLVACVKHNHCIAEVKVSGSFRMQANVICHSVPMPEVYAELPPSRAQLDEVFAFLDPTDQPRRNTSGLPFW